jgi:hypothetical protein
VAVFEFKAVERGQGNAVSAIEVAQGLKKLSPALVIREFGLVGLPSGVGACNFMNSHHLPPIRRVLVRARSVLEPPGAARHGLAFGH